MSIKIVAPGSIVVGVDGSAQSELAVTWAAEQAQLEARSLTLVHGTGDAMPWWAGTSWADVSGELEAATVAGRQLLEATRAHVSARYPNVETHTLLQQVDARQVLLELSERASVVVVGSRGRGPVASLVLGSVSGAVTRQSACPVVVLRPRDPGITPLGILVGVDRDGRSRAAVEFAYRQASLRRLSLTVAYCSFDVTVDAGDAPEIPYDTPGYEVERLVIDESVNGLSEKFPDVRVTLTLGRGLVDTFLAQASRSRDMVVVGAHTDTIPLGGLFDRNADRSVLLHSPSVVAVVPESSSRA